ncbi:DUF1003 domain-containing protein [bacterium]|nr:DUF1003 domain-containing protein [bacterium]
MTQEQIAQKALTVTRWVGSPASIVIHTLAFLGAFFLSFQGVVEWDRMLLVLTTVVSLEAIYLAIFIQMTINYTTQSIKEVSADVDEIQKDIDEIQEDVGEIQEDVGEIQEDVGEIQEDVGEIQGDVDELQEDVEDISEDESEDDRRSTEHTKTLAEIQDALRTLLGDIEKLKR